MPPPNRSRRSLETGIGAPEVLAAATVVMGAISVAFHLTSLFQSARLAHTVMSDGLWQTVVQSLGGKLHVTEDVLGADVDLGPLLAGCIGFSIACWLAGGWLIARQRAISWRDALAVWGISGWRWWFIPLVWEFADIFAARVGAPNVQAFLESTPSFWLTLVGAGWLTTGICLARPESPAAESTASDALPSDDFRVPRIVWCAAAAYFVCFGAMNWLLYESLQVPHGDSAMYEEHLWNLLHGKGFRSYLDNGRLFLGEHVQVVHLLLIPFYVLWPSHVLLELCQSLALAAGAIPVFWIVRRHTGSSRAAALLSIAYLLYFPMQFLDIAIDFKTFRPNSFEIPFFLFALDALERKKFGRMMIWLALALSAQEDAAAIIAPLGVWMAVTSWRKPEARSMRRVGIGMAVFGMVYVLLVVKVVLPWFRGGADVHFSQYFSKFGGSSNEIARHLLTQPWVVINELLSPESLLFALALLLPLGLLPLFSPGRLAVALPLFGMLCLSHITNSPRYHFHAPLIPIILWTAAAGLGNAAIVCNWWRRVNPFRRKAGDDNPNEPEKRRIPPENISSSGKSLPVREPIPQAAPALPPTIDIAAPKRVICSRVPGADQREGPETSQIRGSTIGNSLGQQSLKLLLAIWALACSALTDFSLGLGPTSLSFWDPHSRGYWRTMYVPGERAKRVGAVIEQIPPSARVASTDFVHPRLTHYERSYDYSHYRPIVPDDTEYIVIDTQHHYSEIKHPGQVKELRDHPDRWELLPDRTGGYFIVLKRRPHSP